MYVYIVASRIPYGMRGLKYTTYGMAMRNKKSHPIRDAWIEMFGNFGFDAAKKSHPIRDAWIEMRRESTTSPRCRVASHTGCVD